MTEYALVIFKKDDAKDTITMPSGHDLTAAARMCLATDDPRMRRLSVPLLMLADLVAPFERDDPDRKTCCAGIGPYHTTTCELFPRTPERDVTDDSGNRSR